MRARTYIVGILVRAAGIFATFVPWKDERNWLKKNNNHRGDYCCVCPNSGGMIVDGKIYFQQTAANVWKARIRLVLEMLIIYAQNSFLCSAHFVGICGPRNHLGFTVCCQTFEDRGSLFIIRLARKALLTLTDVL